MAWDDYDARQWDVIVIGTGIGGATLGRRLAEKGVSVLFLERGGLGHRSERQGLSASVLDPASRRTRGYWPFPVPLDFGGSPLSLSESLGAGVGGTSVFYAAAFERPERHDLDATDTRAHPTGGWPVPYDRFAAHLDDAEKLFEVNGGQDPLSCEPELALRSPPVLSGGDNALFRQMEAVGLHPYRLRSAIRHVDGCLECIGVKCPRDCKMDGRSAGIEPALKTGNAALVPDFQVTKLTGRNGKIEGVVGRTAGETRCVTGRIVVLSAGGLGSPALLLASASDAWPNGCANSSGLVGRGLMFHLHDLVAVWPPGGSALGYPAKCISLRDLYYVDGQRFGIFQSLGLSASYGNILHALRQRLERSPAARIPILHDLARLPALAADRILGSARIFSGSIEDFPYDTNRVELSRPLDQDSLKLTYTMNDELRRRCRDYRRHLARRFRGVRKMVLTHEPELNYGHPCGTVRFGHDPRTSVLDATCKSHDIDNLYCVDAAFMPTSTGVNPSLTIAANALRVSEHIVEGLTTRNA